MLGAYSSGPPLDQQMITDFLLAGVALAAGVAELTLVIVAASLNWRAFKPHWRVGLALGLLLAGLSLPVLAFDLAYFDPRAASVQQVGYADDTAVMIAWVFKAVALVVAPLWMLGYVLAAYVGTRAQWARAVTLGRARPGRGALGIALGALLGAIFGLVSTAVFAWMDIGVSRVVQEMTASYPGLDEAPLTLVIAMSMLLAGVAAVQEELAYRGAMQGLLTRLGGGSWVGLLLMNLIVVTVFASAHLLNTDAPLIKFTQIALLGSMLAWLMHRFSLGAAIACHLALNLLVTPIEVLGG